MYLGIPVQIIFISVAVDDFTDSEEEGNPLTASVSSLADTHSRRFKSVSSTHICFAVFKFGSQKLT